MRTETKTKKEYLNEIIEIADDGDTIKFLDDGITLINNWGCPLSKWDKNNNTVIYW